MNYEGAGAIIKGEYRYLLWRRWGQQPDVIFVMLNPSYADAFRDDPTIRRCVGFAKSWGYGGILVINLFAYRSTDPKKLWQVEDPIGPGNGGVLTYMTKLSSRVVAAWGVLKHQRALNRAHFTTRIITRTHDLWCIRKTKDGHPAHPLYLPAKLGLSLYHPNRNSF